MSRLPFWSARAFGVRLRSAEASSEASDGRRDHRPAPSCRSVPSAETRPGVQKGVPPALVPVSRCFGLGIRALAPRRAPQNDLNARTWTGVGAGGAGRVCLPGREAQLRPETLSASASSSDVAPVVVAGKSAVVSAGDDEGRISTRGLAAAALALKEELLAEFGRCLVADVTSAVVGAFAGRRSHSQGARDGACSP